jgi:protoheme ferro-lyase
VGIQQFEMTSGLNDSPAFIAALADLVVTAIGADQARDSERLVAAD